MRGPIIEEENGYQIIQRNDGWVVFGDDGTIKDRLPSLEAARKFASSLPAYRRRRGW